MASGVLRRHGGGAGRGGGDSVPPGVQPDQKASPGGHRDRRRGERGRVQEKKEERAGRDSAQVQYCWV